MSEESKVSIIIPCYNAEDWISESIESALNQSWSNTEVIVIDDGSSDRSRDIISSFGDRLRYEFGPNRGGANARNRGLAMSRGNWIQFLDADDIMLANCIEAKLEMSKRVGEHIVPCCKIEYLSFAPREKENPGPVYWGFRDLSTDLSMNMTTQNPCNNWGR